MFVNWNSLGVIAVVLAAEFLIGFFIVRAKARAAAWLIPIMSVLSVHWITAQDQPTLRMLTLIAVLLAGMKVVTAAHAPTRLSWANWFFYCFLWIGMNPKLVETSGDGVDTVFLRRGLSAIAIGALLISLMALYYVSIPIGAGYWLASLLLLISLSLVLHFGLLNINTALVQWLGYRGYSLFRSPFQSGSLSGFWSRTWNIPYIEMVSIVLFKPLASKVSRRVALWLSFLFSGLLHEVALTLPVQSHFGYATAYFLLQAGLIESEQLLPQKRFPKFVFLTALVLPLPWLFNSEIMARVFWPLVT